MIILIIVETTTTKRMYLVSVVSTTYGGRFTALGALSGFLSYQKVRVVTDGYFLFHPLGRVRLDGRAA